MTTTEAARRALCEVSVDLYGKIVGGQAGSWKYPFDERSTQEATFFGIDGSEIKVQMMQMTDYMQLMDLEELEASAVHLPFGGGRWKMLIILPNKKDGLPKLLQALRVPKTLENILKGGNFYSRKVEMSLPRFKLSESDLLDMIPILMECGIEAVFDESKANLSGICSEPKLFVSQVVHKAILEVDEKGATAAAATAGMMDCLSSAPTPIFEFMVDHPFFVSIICDDSVPVFLGHVVIPEKN